MAAAETDRPNDGYGTAVLGSVLGLLVGVLAVGFALAVVVGALGLLTPWRVTPDTLLTLAQLGLLGAPGGCAVALHRAGQPGARATAALLLGLLAAYAALQPLLVAPQAEVLWSSRLLVVLGVAVLTYLARKLVLIEARKGVAPTAAHRQPR